MIAIGMAIMIGEEVQVNHSAIDVILSVTLSIVLAGTIWLIVTTTRCA